MGIYCQNQLGAAPLYGRDRAIHSSQEDIIRRSMNIHLLDDMEQFSQYPQYLFLFFFCNRTKITFKRDLICPLIPPYTEALRQRSFPTITSKTSGAYVHRRTGM